MGPARDRSSESVAAARAVRGLYADKPKDWRPAPERQFVNALMRRRKKPAATTGRIEIQVEVAAFLQEGAI